MYLSIYLPDIKRVAPLL